jgi:hypothetical protein
MLMPSPSSAPARVSVDQGYGRTSRRYRIPGTDEEYDSVTSILSTIGKPALISWAANQERALVMEAAANLNEDLPVGAPRMSRLAYLATLQARLGKEKAHQKELARGAEIGSQAHGYIEWTLRRERGEAVGPEPRMSDKALWAFMVWQDWQAMVKLRPLALEQVVWSTTHRYAGTLDVLAEITLPGQPGPVPVVGDIKTGKAVYPEALLQVSAYTAALREMEHAPPGVWGRRGAVAQDRERPGCRDSPDLASGAGGAFPDLPPRPGRCGTGNRRSAPPRRSPCDDERNAGRRSGRSGPAARAVPYRLPSPPGLDGCAPGARAGPADAAAHQRVSRR